MNPILLKPSGDRHSQVDRHGPALRRRRRALLPGRSSTSCGRSSPTRSPTCARASTSSSARAPAARPRSTCAHADLANMGLARDGRPAGDRRRRHRPRRRVRVAVRHARAARAPTTRRSSPASSSTSSAATRAILAPGLDAARGAAPAARRSACCRYVEDLWIDAEDSLALEAPPRRGAGRPATRSTSPSCRLRWMTNFTDVDALAAEPGVRVRFTRSPADVERADLVVVPGTKATVEDLERLRAAGSTARSRARRRRRADPRHLRRLPAARRAHRRRRRVARAARSPASGCCR